MLGSLELPDLDRSRLFARLRQGFPLDWRGAHGPSHWARVRRIGLDLAARTGADARVVELFALLHDARRESECDDPHHGSRAADLAHELRGDLVILSSPAFEQLVQALHHHSEGHCDADATIQVCWDADRLDLARVGIRPDPGRLCTAAARDPSFLAHAVARAERWALWDSNRWRKQ